MKSPCKDCQNRYTACHDTCEKYIEFRKERRNEVDFLNNCSRKGPYVKQTKHIAKVLKGKK
jgi:hypothetical protein